MRAAAFLEPCGLDRGGGVVRLRARQRPAVGAHAVVPGRPDREAAPAAPDVEQGLAGAQFELATDVVELVLLGLLQLPVGIAIVRAGVDHERIEEQLVELVRDVVVVGDRPGVLGSAARFHDDTSRIPKIPPKTTWRRVTYAWPGKGAIGRSAGRRPDARSDARSISRRRGRSTRGPETTPIPTLSTSSLGKYQP